MLILITIKDTGAQFYQPIMSMRSQGEAMRGFIDAINDPNNKQLNQHPDDFEMYLVGTFDDQTGTITPEKKPKLLMRGKDAKTKL